MKKILSVLFILIITLTVLPGCHTDEAPGASATPGETLFSKTDDEMFTDRDTNTYYDNETAVFITLSEAGATASNESVTILDNRVTITRDGTYHISGTLTNGQIIVDAPETAKPHLVLAQAAITSADSAALYIRSADKVIVTLIGDNSLSGAEAFTATDENNVNAAVYSREDLTFNGDGSLTVASPAGHGISCKDDLVFTGGTYSITSASHGVDANDSIRIKGSAFTITAGKDGLHAENTEDTTQGFVYISDITLRATAEGDGVSASSFVQVERGEITLLCGGGYTNGESHSSSMWGGGRPRGTSSTDTTTEDASTSMKGIKGASGVLISAGTFSIDAADDALHANDYLTVNGGTLTIASGDDALHADGTLTVTDGKIDISTCYEGLEGLHVLITGGDITLKATDDGINAAGGNDSSGDGGRDNMFGGGRPGGWGSSSSSNGSITISGGKLYINSSGDGMDANGTLTISGGHTTVVGPTQGDTATLDYDVSGVITGGTFIGTGAAGMAQSFSDSEQGVIALSINSAQSAGTTITLTDSNGTTLLTYAPELSFQVVIISMPEIKKGETYTVTVGNLSGTFEAE